MKYQPTDRSTIVEKDLVESIKEQASTIEIEATDGISLKCGGNVLTIDSSGISLKGSMVDTNASSDGVTASEVSIPDIEKPLYNKLRVTALKASLTKQDDITQLLTFTATVEKFEDGSWGETTDLNESQLSQINWYFIKNNDEQDTDVLTDNPTDDTITIDGLEMSVTLNEENIYQYGHAHAFVVDSDVENGHAVSELKRQIDVVSVRGKNLLEVNAKEVNYRAELNIDNPTEKEIKDLKVEISEKDASGTITVKDAKVDEDLTIKHELTKKTDDEPKIVEVGVKVYPKQYPSNSGETISYIRPLQAADEKVVNARPDNKDNEYINSISDEIYTIRADTSLEEGTEVTAVLNIIGYDGSVLTTVKKETYVENQKVEQDFDIEKIIKDKQLVKEEIQKFKGVIQCQK